MPNHPWIPNAIIRWLRGEKNKRLTFELDEEAWDYLETIAREEGLSVPEMARWLLRWALETSSTKEVYQQRWELLTPREREIAELYSQGIEMEDIAKELVISRETVKTHLYNVTRKMGLKKMYELRRINK
jgi:RNA polymerase sigma factor (sigma-70 family)